MTDSRTELQLALDVARAYLARYLRADPIRQHDDKTSAFGATPTEVQTTLRGAHPQPDVTQEQRLVTRALVILEERLSTVPGSRFAMLASRYRLTTLDLAIICALLAPELDHTLERAYGFALDDVSRKRPDVGFYARVLGGGDGVDRVLEKLDDGAPLRRHGIVVVEPGGALALRPIRIADRILSFLRGYDPLDELVAGCARLTTSAPPLETIVMAPGVLDRIIAALSPTDGPPRVLLAGHDGSGRALAVESLLCAVGAAAIRVDLGAIADHPLGHERLRAVVREARLRHFGLIFETSGIGKLELDPSLVRSLSLVSRELPLPVVFVLRDRPAWLGQALPGLVELDIPLASFRERLVLWRRALPPPQAADEDLEIVAGRYAFTGAMITKTAERASQAARLRGASKVELDDLGSAASLMFARELGGLAQRIPAGFSWADLVLPRETHNAVLEVVRFARHRAFLLEEWGFDAKLPYGRGVSAILAGPPGTGKTMVAQLISKELGYDLYRIDLSQIVDKYIGETEKNLGRLFDQAEQSHAVLFFDEADSLFAKRTNVQSSNDRYANLEVNYLLQRMEVFDGVTLLATNLSQGIDDAFRRRVRFSIAFELPDEHERKRLWKSMFPPKTPLASEIDWDALARGFAMAGGYIKKAVLRAALAAVETRRPITSADLLEAARLEYREMGRIA